MSNENIKEWSPSKKWNPFNSYKLLAQVPRWELIQRNKSIPQPVLVTVDPVNMCNLKCSWCNAHSILESNTSMLSRKSLLRIADFLTVWQGTKKWPKGVETICIAGGGESLLNPYIDEFIEVCIAKGIEVGVVTNGTLIDKHLEALSKCTWVGVSIDAGTRQTFANAKGADLFDKVISNIKKLIDYSEEHDTKLALKKQGYGVSYKYLLHSSNMSEIYTAAEIAKRVGCRNFHMRPAGIPWSDIQNEKRKDFFKFTPDVIKKFKAEVNKARKLESEEFGIFGITHKFDNKFNPANFFSNCYAIFMTGVFMPGTDGNEDSINFGLCCDKRGDPEVLLEENIVDPKIIAESWGGKKHAGIFEKIKVDRCPRCTYQPHNQIYEHVIKDDSMTYKFI
jgi:organic radical activating enzyme